MIYDISPSISSLSAVFPGDTPFARKISMDFSLGHHLSLSSISTTLHIGSHADAPSHYHKNGKTIDQVSLDLYYGDCQVIDVSHLQGEIKKKDFKEYILSKTTNLANRVLLKTKSMPNSNEWIKDFSYPSVELIEWLGIENNVRLIGIDTPSMDHSESKDLLSHLCFYKLQMAILEGLVLDTVPEGMYTLAAFPLKLEGAEASPVRAVLIC